MQSLNLVYLNYKFEFLLPLTQDSLQLEIQKDNYNSLYATP